MEHLFSQFLPFVAQPRSANAASGNYFCHQCNTNITPNRNEEDGNVTCPHCNEGFIEEIEQDLGNNTENPGTPPPGGMHAQLGGHPFPSLLQFLEQINSMEGGGAGPQFQTRTFNIHFNGNQNGNHGQLPFANIFQMMMNEGSGQSMDDIISQIMENYDGPMGTPPASKSEIEKLPTVKITEEQQAAGIGCPVCQDDYKVDEEVTEMPCGHIFHHDCLIPWLERHNSCPTCRHELSTDDPDYEQQRAQRNNSNSRY